MDIYTKRKKLFIVTGLIGILIVLVCTYLIVNKNPYGNELEISNLDEYTSGDPTDKQTLDRIKYDLFKTVSLNLDKPISNKSIKDVVIRKDTFKENYEDLNEVSFIVDIASIKQSYFVTYQWSHRDGVHPEEYGIQVTCLPIDELKYGDFDCVDERISEIGVEYYDPVEKILPYEEEYKFTVRDYIVANENSTLLNVDAFVPNWASDPDEVLDSYTENINSWLKSKKLDPGKYEINYTY